MTSLSRCTRLAKMIGALALFLAVFFDCPETSAEQTSDLPEVKVTCP